MKILILGDPQGRLPKGLTKIIKKNKIELLICLGDIPLPPKNPVDPKSWTKKFTEKSIVSYQKIISKLCSYGVPVLTLRGNMFHRKNEDYSFEKITKRIFKKHKNLFHKKTGILKFNRKNFIFFDMIYEKHSSRRKRGLTKEIKKSNKSREKKLNKLFRQLKNPILISHAPPFGYLDQLNFKGISKELKGKHVGSKILLKAIKKHKPKYVFCGHIHEAKGKKRVGKTIVYNVGCCGNYVVVDI